MLYGMPTYIHGMPIYIHKQHLKIIPKSRNSCMHLICVYSCELSGHEKIKSYGMFVILNYNTHFMCVDYHDTFRNHKKKKRNAGI